MKSPPEEEAESAATAVVEKDADADETARILDENDAGDDAGDEITYHLLGGATGQEQSNTNEDERAASENDVGFNIYTMEDFTALVGDSVGDEHIVEEPGDNVHYLVTDLEQDTSGGEEALTTSSSTTTTTSTTTTLATLPPDSETSHSHLQSLHLKAGGERFDDPELFNNGDYHRKYSAEKNGQNSLLNRPVRWDPPDLFEVVETEAAPRAPDTENENEAGKIYCKSTDGKFGAKKGGVLLRYQYELVVDRRNIDGGSVEGILPTLEGGITDSLLPVFFGEECLDALKKEGRSGTAVVRVGPLLRRNLRAQDHRRLNKVVGIDSLPEDFVLEGKECTIEGTLSDGQCYTMEGSLTLYFPPNYSIRTLVQGAHLKTLNALRDDMSQGLLVSRVDHPGILKLNFLDSSYSLSPIIPSELEPEAEPQNNVGIQEEEGKSNVGVLVAAILIPLLLLCCCGFCFWRWKRGGGSLNDIADLMAPPKKKSGNRSSTHDSDNDDEDSLGKHKQERKKKKKKKKQRKAKGSKKSRKSDRSSVGSNSLSYNSDSEASEESELSPIAEQSLPTFDPTRRRPPSFRNRKKNKKGRSDYDADDSRDSPRSSMRSSRSSRSLRSSQRSSMRSSTRSSIRSSQRSASIYSSHTSQHMQGSASSFRRHPEFHSTDGTDTDNTDTDNTNTDTDDTFGKSTTTSSSSDRDSTTSSGSSSDDSSTTSSDRGSTEGSTTTSSRGSTTRSGSKETSTSTSTSDEDNNSTTTSTSDNDSTTSTTSSDEEDSEAEDQFELGPSFHSNFLKARAAGRTRRQEQRQAARQRSSKPSTNTNNNLIMTGGVEEDSVSVMTGMTGATGMHSVSSQATAQVKNTKVPGSIGGDDVSVMTSATGLSGATRKVSNTGGGGGIYGRRNNNDHNPGLGHGYGGF
mmetsp:Transcript_42512/g.89247  ORF Transcript_42512/g.89247 Transcript_42512/m.89247 type:complete len:912 (+) Transcript_42512:46-2781(+)